MKNNCFLKKWGKLIFSIIIVFSITNINLLIAQEGNAKKTPESYLKVFPSFDTALDSPVFVVDFTNNKSQTLDLLKLFGKKTIILDGKKYPIQWIKYGGSNFNLKPGETFTYEIDIGGYLPNSVKQKYSKPLKRWRWKIPLESGKHTLIVQFAGEESEEIVFFWNGDDPFLYK